MVPLIEYMNGQLRELLTNYGEIGGIWFDGWWDRPEAPWQLDRTYALIHELQPQALIGANHHRRPFPGEDFQMFEKDLPGGRTADFNKDSEIGDLPLETCETMNGSWGFNLTDRRHKSTRDLIRYLVRAAGSNANFLLNVGPMPNGGIQPEFVSRLQEIGDGRRRMERRSTAPAAVRSRPMPGASRRERATACSCTCSTRRIPRCCCRLSGPGFAARASWALAAPPSSPSTISASS